MSIIYHSLQIFFGKIIYHGGDNGANDGSWRSTEMMDLCVSDYREAATRRQEGAADKGMSSSGGL